MKVGKGLKVEIFQRSVLKNTTWPLLIFKRCTKANPLLLRWQRAVFWYLPFSEKKVKVLKVLYFSSGDFPLDPP